jgi:multidrug resistance efflux pump
MPQYASEKPVPRIKAFGLLLAMLVAAGSFILVALTHDPKQAVSSPSPANAAIVPQIADAKSEMEIRLRGKSFAALKRPVALAFSGILTEVRVQEGDDVEKGQILAVYKLDRQSMMHVHNVLFAGSIDNLKASVKAEEEKLQEYSEIELPRKEKALRDAEKQLHDLRTLFHKGMATEQALEKAEYTLKTHRENLEQYKEAIDQQRQNLERQKERLRHQIATYNRQVDLLEWETKRSYDQGNLPKDIAYLKAPISGKIFEVHPALRTGAYLNKGFEAMSVAPSGIVLVRCRVHELDLVKLRPGQAGTVTFDALPEKSYRAAVTRIPWASLNPSLTVPADYQIECQLDDPDGLLKEGLTCNVKLSITQ